MYPLASIFEPWVGLSAAELDGFHNEQHGADDEATRLTCALKCVIDAAARRSRH